MNSSKLKINHARFFSRPGSPPRYACAVSFSPAEGGRLSAIRYARSTALFRSPSLSFLRRSANIVVAFSISGLFIINRPCGAVTVCVRDGHGARPSSTSKDCRKLGVISRLVEKPRTIYTPRRFVLASALASPILVAPRLRGLRGSISKDGPPRVLSRLPADESIESQIGSASSRCRRKRQRKRPKGSASIFFFVNSLSPELASR